MLVLTAVSVVAFYARLGPAELEYALLTDPLAAGDAVFEPVTMDAWSRQNRTEGLNPQTLRIRIQDDLQRRRQELAARCLRFVERYPGQRAGSRGLVGGRPGRQRPTGRTGPAGGPDQVQCLVPRAGIGGAVGATGQASYPHSPQAALAHWRLGELAMRRGEVHQAYRHLITAQEELTRQAARARRRAPAGGPSRRSLAPEPPVPSDRYYGEATFAVRRLLWLMDSNDVLERSPLGRGPGGLS